ncbi:MAG: 2-iminoacetate synthase ThiH, partial [Bacteroidales bacterium]|nr:2-iminoacetate synthase ThiH [Bacteroidales bacterium]
LTESEIEEELVVLKEMGYDHILLVSGEDRRVCGLDYLKEAIKQTKKEFAQVSVEVQPMETEEYAQLKEAGLHAVYVYQETYHEANYKSYHPKGKKSNYRYRLETPERIGQAGIHKMGLGVLLGLEDWRTDSFYTALHVQYLEKHFWQMKYGLSFPRLRPHAGGFEPNSIINHRQLLQLMCAYRLFNAQVEISLSTRESAFFRDNVMKLGVTTMSAGSKTDPGGYSHPNEALEQFSVNDERNPMLVAEAVNARGYEVVWKDWDSFM